MKNIKTAILLIAAITLVVLYIYYNNQAKIIDVDKDLLQPPAETPTNTMPEGALSTCIDKTIGESCSFIINQQEHIGICHDIVGTLTCGPGTETSEENEPQ